MHAIRASTTTAVTPLAQRDATAAAGAPAVAKARTRPAATAPAHAPAAPGAARTLRAWGPGLQQDLASAQQARQFLDRTAADLQGLKADLSARLAGRPDQGGRSQARLEQLSATWHERRAASGGSVDAQLQYTAANGAVQRFTVPGLTLDRLAGGASESLTFAVAGARGPVSIALGPDTTDETVVQRFDQAFAAAGVRVAADASGALVFSVGEASWPAVRDSFAVKGDGIRFPTGRLNRVRTDAVPDAVRPQAWSQDDSDKAALRRTLQEVVRALDRIQQARATVARALAEASARIDALQPASSPEQAAAMANDFARDAAATGFSDTARLAGALVGLGRSRVLALLALPPTR